MVVHEDDSVCGTEIDSNPSGPRQEERFDTFTGTRVKGVYQLSAIDSICPAVYKTIGNLRSTTRP